MLDGILGRGFASRCKSLIKLTKNRIEVIKRKRSATLKFLKKDIADLLANGLDINAYGRAEGLLAELAQFSCYDFVDKSCDFVLKHLTVMQKLRHCPEDCREAVSSLMFAAARFSDLPELRELRDIFHERYGNTVELFASQEFVEKLSSKPPTMEKKVQLMRDIALEFSIKWDSRAFEKRMSKPSVPWQDQPKVYGSANVKDDKFKSINGKETVSKGDRHDKESSVPKRDDHNTQFRHEIPSRGYKPVSVREETSVNRDNYDILFQGRQEARVEKHDNREEDTPLKAVRLGSSSEKKRIESLDNGYKLHDGRESIVPKKDVRGTPRGSGITPSNEQLSSKSDGKASLAVNGYGSQQKMGSSAIDVQAEAYKSNSFHNHAIPPPYTKPNSKLKESKGEIDLGPSHSGFNGNVVSEDPSRGYKVDAGNGSEKIRGENHPDHDRQKLGQGNANNGGFDTKIYYQDDGVTNPIPKPRPSRRRHSKSQSSHDDVGNLEEAGTVKRRSRSRRRDDPRRGLQVLFDDEKYKKDEEERMIDKLLMHYSKKPSAYEPGRVSRNSRSRHAHDQGSDADRLPRHSSREGPDDIAEGTAHPPRSISLPREQTTSSEATTTKVFTRAASFQPDRSSPARHVHPKLPDYDDLAARFAALKGR